MKLTPVKGTNDYLPQETELRYFLQNEILKVYKSYGFMRISTPILEDIENLEGSDGGENLNLIFKVLQRGEKLEKTIKNKDFENLADVGLRYDLTLPLSRFYANNKSKLPIPFKCIQIDRVYRAERPQKGRLREFMQCDIDVIGSSSIETEIELIEATSTALLRVGLEKFTVKVNNRKVLRTFIERLGFKKEDIDSICVSLDKLDKIGVMGIEEELLNKGLQLNIVKKLVSLLEKPLSLNEVEQICGKMLEIENLKIMIDSIKRLAQKRYDIEYDISLVRGQGYYTGNVFEIQSDKFNGAIAGGGRYDNLIGSFLKESEPAVGISIGFERIFSILSEMRTKVTVNRKKIALFYEKDFIGCMQFANNIREQYDISIYEKPKKLKKLLDILTEFEYYGYLVMGEGEDVKILKK